MSLSLLLGFKIAFFIASCIGSFFGGGVVLDALAFGQVSSSASSEGGDDGASVGTASGDFVSASGTTTFSSSSGGSGDKVFAFGGGSGKGTTGSHSAV